MRKETRQIALLWLILAAANLLLHFPILKGYFYYDDFQILGQLKDYPTWTSAILNSFQQGYGLRFFEDLILWMRVKQFGWQPAPYFVISLIQNYLVALLVFIFAQQLFHRTKVSFIASLIFLTAFPPLQVVNWITGSVVSLVALFYLGTLILYIQALRTSKVGWYIAALAGFTLAMLTNEYSITLFPVLALLTLALWKDFDRLNPEIRPKQAALYLMPFLLILIPYLAYQLHLLSQGTSEGAGLGGYRLGRHVLKNVTNLTHLVIPDLYFPRVTHFLQVYFPRGQRLLVMIDPLVWAAGLIGTAWVLWKGSSRMRFLVLFIFLAYAPFTLWIKGDMAHSPRYLYLPLVGFSILVAIFLVWMSDWLAKKRLGKAVIWLGGFLAIWIVYNAVPIYYFQALDVANGQVRQGLIAQVRGLHPQFPPEAVVYLGVPNKDFRDLGWGIPEFYATPLQVIPSPPASLPERPGSNEFIFQYKKGKLVEIK
jgi:hypothetical protein